jgi:two-component system cell cycle sensor histidine kinase/response regulator CckA
MPDRARGGFDREAGQEAGGSDGGQGPGAPAARSAAAPLPPPCDPAGDATAASLTEAPLHPRLACAFGAASRAGGGFVALTGLVGFLVLLLDAPALKIATPALAAMKVNTTVALMLAGAATWLLGGRHRTRATRRVARTLAAVVVLVGLVTLLEYWWGWSPGIDDLLLRRPLVDPLGVAAFASRMSPATAASFFLLGFALVLLDLGSARSRTRPTEWLVLPVCIISLLTLLGYLYGAQELYEVGFFSSMALHTTLAFFSCSLAILLARPEHGIARVMASATPGGVLARRLLPAALLVPVATGWLRLRGQQLGLYDTEFGLAMLVSANIFSFNIFIYWTARGLIRVDADRRRMEEMVRQHREHLDITLRSIGDGVISADANGRVIQMNAVAEAMTGWSSGEAYGRPVGEIFHIVNEQTRQPAESPFIRILKDGASVTLARHTALISRDGQERAIADSGAPIKDDNGATRGVVLVFRDTTEERKAEAALRRSQVLFSRLSSAGIIGIIVVDLDGKVTEVNDTLLAILGYAREEILSGSVPWPNLTPPEWVQADDLARRDLKDRGVAQPRQKEYFRKDGSRAPVLVGVAMLDGTNCIAFVLDLTERARSEEARAGLAVEAMRQQAGRRQAEASLRDTEEQLRQSQKMEAVGRLAGGIAHDFNNLLSVILGYGRLLIDDLHPVDPKRQHVEEMIQAGERAASLTRQLLAFSRQQVLQPKILDLNETINGMSTLLTRLIGEDIELSVRSTATLARVFVDPGQIEQIVMNLVVNSRDAMPHGGKLTIETGNIDLEESYASDHAGVKAGPHVVLSVTDTGAGIDKAIQHRIFDPFFTTKEQGKGTGLGLAMVFGIVKQSGGSIWVYSEPGAGTTFKVYLPRCDQEPAPVVDGAKTPLKGPVSATILLVEDEEQVRVLTHNILRRAGYHVLAFASGGDALVTCAHHEERIDLLLTDVVMPKMSGRQLAERVVQIRPEVKVLFMSGYTGDAIVHHGVLDAGLAFLQKPIMPDALLRKVQEVLNTAP